MIFQVNKGLINLIKKILKRLINKDELRHAFTYNYQKLQVFLCKFPKSDTRYFMLAVIVISENLSPNHLC